MQIILSFRSHIAKHGTSDSALRELLYEDERHSTESSRLASLSSAAEDDLSDSAAQVRVKRSSPRKKTAVSSARYFHLDQIFVPRKVRSRPLTLSSIEKLK